MIFRRFYIIAFIIILKTFTDCDTFAGTHGIFNENWPVSIAPQYNIQVRVLHASAERLASAILVLDPTDISACDRMATMADILSVDC